MVTAAPSVQTQGIAPTRRWLLGFVALAVIWGSSFLFIKVGVSELHPMYLTLGRVAVGALTLMIVLGITRDRIPTDPKLWAHMSLVGVFGVALPFTLFAYGEQRISSTLAGIWNATTPLVVLPLAVWLFRTERMTWRRAIGLGLGFVGVLVILGVWEGVGGAALTGQLMCFGAAACYGVVIPYFKRFVAGGAQSGVAISTVQVLVALGALLVVTPIVAGAPPNPGDLSLDVIGSVVALGALGTGIAFVIHTRNIRVAGATTASMVTYFIPVVATIVGILVLDEHVSWYQPVGAAVVLAGVAISQSRRRSGSTAPARAGDIRSSEPYTVASEAAACDPTRDDGRPGGRVPELSERRDTPH